LEKDLSVFLQTPTGPNYADMAPILATHQHKAWI